MIDVQEAKQFLSALSSHDDGTVFSFQTLYDVKPEHDVERRIAEEKRLTRVIHGRFEEVVDELIEMNRKGAGVFVCVNRTNGMGLRGKDVDRIRSFFVDDDTDHLRSDQLTLPPSIVVRSKRGNHFYWLASNGTAKDHFGPAQKALAEKFATDKSVFNLNRVMRMPGFMHNKGDPYKVCLEHVDLKAAYELSDVASAFGLDIEQYVYTPRTNVDSADVATIPIDRRIQRARGMLHAIGPAIRNSGEGHEKTMAACRVGNDFAVEDFTFLVLLQEWGAGCDPPWDSGQLESFYFSTLGSVNSAKWPWGGKLLDSAYASRRPDGVNPATMYRHTEVPWSNNEEQAARYGGHEEPYQVTVIHQGERPPEIPSQSLRPAASRRVIEIAPALPQEQVVMNHGSKTAGRKSQGQYRLGAAIEDTLGVVSYGDDARKPREMAHIMGQEYEFRRDDSRCVYIYSKNVWKETSREFIEKLAMQYTSFSKLKIKDLKEAAGLALTRNHIQNIRWNQVKLSEISIDNGVLDFVTGELREHRHEDYLDRVIPIDYTPGATCELWEKCLDQWLPDMEEEQDALQQFFGYILMPHARYKKAMILFGPSDTGKSQICDIAIALAGGVENICSISPDVMDDDRKLAPIKGKALNCIADLKKNTVLADGGFKQLVSTGDAIQVDQKFTRAEMYTPTAKHLFATNNLPTVRDVTDAVYRRILILGFNKVVPLDKQDANLSTKLKEELPGILNWAIDGARKLHANRGQWPTVTSSEELIQEYKLTQNPLYFYIKESEEVVEEPTGRIKTEDLRVRMNKFNGGKNEYGRRGFSKLIEGLALNLPTVERKKIGGTSCVVGLKWTQGQEDLPLGE